MVSYRNCILIQLLLLPYEINDFIFRQNLLVYAFARVCIQHFWLEVVRTPVDAEFPRRVDQPAGRLGNRHTANERMPEWVAIGQFTTQRLRYSTAQRPWQVPQVVVVTWLSHKTLTNFHPKRNVTTKCQE